MKDVAFLIGSPRSGTTILSQILGLHPDIASWHEPFYVWKRFLASEKNEIWDNKKLNEKIKRKIHREFDIFKKKSRKKLVLDKSPSHVFNISTINTIFPEAKWIHIIRDGRDVTLSIKKEWDIRKHSVKGKDFFHLFGTVKRMLGYQPFLRYKLKAILFELSSNATLNPSKYLNKSKWKGDVGWGPRFGGWEHFLQTHSTLEFNSMQWVKSVEAAQQIWPILQDNNKLEIRYEYLLRFPQDTIKNILNFLKMKVDNNYFESIPKLNSSNFNKWKEEFTPLEIEKIKPILNPWLKKLGYVDNDIW